MAQVPNDNPMRQYILNWRPSPLETKLGAPLLRLETRFDSTALPSAIDLSGHDSAVKDQSTLGACTAFAAIALVEHIAKRNSRASDWSELYLYYNTRVRILNWPAHQDTGAYVSSTMQALQKYGDAREADWRYNVGRFGDVPPATAYRRGALNQVIKTAYVQTSVVAIRAAIASGRPVDIGFVCYSNFTEVGAVYTSGHIPLPTPGSWVTGGHSVALIGYDDATREFKFKNSWSSSFGDAGYGFLPYDYVSGYTIEAPRQPLVSDCWTILSVEFESDFVILRGENPAAEGLQLSAIAPDAEEV